MNLTQMTQAANQYTDENFRTNQTMFFVNECIGNINTELNSELPFITDANVSYLALSETWIRQLFVPYICYSIKMNDGSLQEASVYLRGYEKALQKLFTNKDLAISADYQNASFDSGAVQIDYATNLSAFGLYPADNFIPEYDERKLYYVGDLVYYNYTTYECIKSSTGNLPTVTTYWSVYS